AFLCQGLLLSQCCLRTGKTEGQELVHRVKGHAATKPIHPASGPCAPSSSSAARSSNRCWPVLCVLLADRPRSPPRSIRKLSGLCRLEKLARGRQHVVVR